MKKLLSIFSLLTLSFILVGCDLSLIIDVEVTEDQLTTFVTTTAPIYDGDDEEDLILHFIDVGQADSIFIQLPNDETMLIDAGNNGDGPKIIAYMKALNVQRIDYVVGTHPHADHIGGLDEVINADFEFDNVYLPFKEHDTKTFIDVLDAIENRGLEITFAEPEADGMTIIDTEVDGKPFHMTIIGPLKEYRDINDNSIVIRIVYGATSYLFMGDAETRAENDMLAANINVSANLIKLGHHGSGTSSSEAFLRAVNPQIAIIQVSEGAYSNVPHPDVLARLDEMGIATYRNDELGTIVVRSNGVKINVANSDFEPHPNEQPEPVEPDPDPEMLEAVPGDIVVNEFLPAPSAGNPEWVELYNLTDQAIDIGGYVIDDDGGANRAFTIPEGTFIEAYGFVTFDFTNLFNNQGGDRVRLYNREGDLIDLFIYTKTTHDFSYYRLTDGGEWGQAMNPYPSKNESNEN